MTKCKYIIIFILFSFYSVAQTDQENYERALEKLSCMLNGSCELSFKEAVLTVENTYFENKLDTNYFNIKISQLVKITKKVYENYKLDYQENDKEEVKKYASIFKIMTDTIPIKIDSGFIVYHLPFFYDFNDIWGYSDWSNMFVSKLLNTKKGNCHSLPYLYKILAKEIGVEAHIAVAPSHFYIKHKNEVNGWYNTELTSGVFPIDAWIMASGYVHLDGIRNKLYMEALNEKQSIALCLIDLAKGYQRKLGSQVNYKFILQCCDTALKYYPHYINALLLQVETKKKQFELIMREHEAKHASEVLFIPRAKELFSDMTALYSRIHKLGYRKMPNNMYLNWLTSLKEERDKYENKEIIK